MQMIENVGDFEASVRYAKAVGNPGTDAGSGGGRKKDRRTVLDLMLGDVSKDLPDARRCWSSR